MLRVIRDLAYGTNPHQQLDIYAHRDVKHRPVIIFWPGGSWTNDYRSKSTLLGRSLAKMGYVVVIASYRTFPEVKFPTFVEDGAKVVAWVDHHIRGYGGDSTRVAVMGHSAGAHIAATLALDQSYVRDFGLPISPIRALVGLSGPYNFTPKSELAPIFADFDRSLWNPINYVSVDAPPALLIHGGRDRVVKPENSRDLRDRLQKVGVKVELYIYRSLEHFAPLGLLVVPGSPVRRRINAFLAKYL